MLTQGAAEQSPMVSGIGHNAMTNIGRILETNLENISRLVSYYENDVDCIRNVANQAKQLMELIKAMGQRFSSSHVLDVFRGSMSQQVSAFEEFKIWLLFGYC